MKLISIIGAIAIGCFAIGIQNQASATLPTPEDRSALSSESIAYTEILDYGAALEELQRSLTFRGEPLNPRAVAALIPWLSDTLPGAIAVDLEGTVADTNQFGGEVYPLEEGRIFAEWTDAGDSKFVGYQPVGRLDNGVHVLRVWINTGGSGIFPFLMLVSFDLDTEIDNGYVRQRLVMTRRGEFALGGGYDGDITLSGNTLMLTPAPHGEASQTVQLE
ncbi:hypothetical protein PN498_24965 [Oscillatoria sp. CS-180]|uniref:hypothetical protein n=1 Tax=Oscillatoria sp. CS-180 TaxID=3021720 RepID=UPI00232E052B|nr:hypothetical protein [Oscillatoria sp. CS-180]MDB9529268.1 hypothetical protein [Oscillatoria sp. CS-180]